MQRKRFQKTLISLAGSAGLTLFLLETALRVSKPVQLVGTSHQPTIYVKDDRNGYSYGPRRRGWIHRNFEIDNVVITNSRGFHDIERRSPRPTPPLRIAAIGDSFTASLHVPIPNTWTQILEKECEARTQSPVDVINLGLDGTGTDVHRNILESYLASNGVDFVLLALDKDDILDVQIGRIYREVREGYVIAYQSERQRRKVVHYIDTNKPSTLTRWLFRKSYFLRSVMNASTRKNLMRTNFVSPLMAGIPDLSRHDIKETQRRVEEAFGDIIALSEAHRFGFGVVPVPRRDDRRAGMARFVLNRTLSRRTLDRIDVIDVMATLDEILAREQLKFDELFWQNDAHFNVAGNRIFGVAVARAIAGRLAEASRRNRPRGAAPAPARPPVGP